MTFELSLSNGKLTNFSFRSHATELTYNEAMEIMEWSGDPTPLLQKYASNPEVLDIIPFTSREGISLMGLFLLLKGNVLEYMPAEVPKSIHFKGSSLTFSRLSILFQDYKDLTVGDYQAVLKMKKELIKSSFPMEALAELFEPGFDAEEAKDEMTWALYITTQIYILRILSVYNALERLAPKPGLRRWIISAYLRSQAWRLQ